jgi:ethanolamine utilization protein EutQ (cupin superfamily)
MALFLALAGLSACNPGPSGAVADEASARLAYLGLDRAIDRAIDLGFAGFNAADSANIPEQTDDGELSGLMTIGGKVDQGASANKGMRLEMTLAGDYADVILEGETDVIYNGGPAALDMSFKGLPDADFSGTLRGTFAMDRDLVGDVALDLSMSGQTQDAGDGTIVRVPGSIRVTGSATSDYGVFMVDVSL